MRALLALPLLLALAPAAAAQSAGPAAAEPPIDPLECLARPYFPETPVYYIVWWCTGGELGIPEPIEHFTTCRMGFPVTDVECDFLSTPALWETLREQADRVRGCVENRPTVGCVLGVQPDPVACLINYIRTQTPCR
jgi:hypothetical protein